MVKELKNKSLTFIVRWLVLLFILGRLLFYISSNQQFFLRPSDLPYLIETYSKSQYVVGSASKEGIGDDGLYAFAGWYYLFQGGDVSAVDFTHPPLGKYLIGLSFLLFQNENTINIIYFSILLFITYKIGMILLKNNLLSLIAVAVLSTDQLFLDNLIRSLLDLPFTLFFTIAVYFFLLGLTDSKYYYLSMIFWGMSFSTRFFPAIVIVLSFLFLIIFFYKRKDLLHFILSSFLVPLVYLISHISFFVYHPSIIEFLRHKKWMVSWFMGSPAILGNIWRNILTSRYIDTGNKLVSNQQWVITLPIVVLSALIPVKKYLLFRKNIEVSVLYGLCVLYIIYVTILTSGVQKFIMPIYPLLCILAVSNLYRLYSIINAWRRRI